MTGKYTKCVCACMLMLLYPMLNIRSGFCVPSYPHIVNVLSLVFELANLGSAWKGH